MGEESLSEPHIAVEPNPIKKCQRSASKDRAEINNTPVTFIRTSAGVLGQAAASFPIGSHAFVWSCYTKRIPNDEESISTYDMLIKNVASTA